MSKMGDSLSRMFGRRRKSADLAARLESTISAGKEGSEALNALQELAANEALTRHSGATDEKSIGPSQASTQSEALSGDRFVRERDRPLDLEPTPVSISLEMRDLVDSLPEIDVYELAEKSRIVAQTLRRQNRSSRNAA